MSGISCCLPNIASNNVLLSNNLMPDKELNCREQLLFLYNFVEKQGYNLNMYPSVVNNLKELCGINCCDLPTSKEDDTIIETDLKVSINVFCDDSIIAESYVIY